MMGGLVNKIQIIQTLMVPSTNWVNFAPRLMMGTGRVKASSFAQIIAASSVSGS
jgi:hypothetical protein